MADDHDDAQDAHEPAANPAAGHWSHGDADAGHDDDADHGDHGDHGPADDRWVLLPLVAGLLIGLAIATAFGLASSASPFA